MDEPLFNLLAMRKGHFRLESGHHGNLWLDLELLCLHPERVRGFAVELAQRLARHEVQIVCGPLVEGAFIALLAAAELGVEFVYAERFAPAPGETLYPVEYRLPDVLRGRVRGQRVAIVNDVINAGSAVRGALADLVACGARPVVMGALLVLGSSASSLAAERGIALESLACLPNDLWLPAECPLCRAGVPLDVSGGN